MGVVRRVWMHRTGPYLAGGLFTSLVTVLALHLWQLPWSVPWGYQGDALSSAAYFQTVLETGWFERQPRLGAPFGQFYYDFPFTDDLHPLMIKIFGVFTSNWVTVFNGYYVLGYLLAGLTAVSFLLRCGLSRSLVVVLAALYAITPYHFIRGQSHFFLGEYWIVPLALNLVLAMALDQPLWGLRACRGRWARTRGVLTGRGAATAVVAVLIVLDGAYYGLFTALLLVLVTGVTAVARRSWATVVRVLPALGVILATFLVISLPDMLFARQHGTNPAALVRSPAWSELYAGKLASLLLPPSYSRIPALARFRSNYNTTYPINTENATLGLIGAIGFVVLLVLPLVVLSRSVAAKPGPPVLGGSAVLAGLSVMAWVGFACAMVGGVGTFVSFFTDAIRGWNRISIFLALIALAGTGLLVDRLLVHAGQRWRRVPALAWRACVLTLLLMIGFLDQVPPFGPKPIGQTVAAFDSDAAFIAALEATVPSGSMIFQLPYIAYPEVPKVHAETNSDQLIPFLHSTTLRFSGGGMKGRPQVDWMGTVSRQPAKTLTRNLAVIGYVGIIVDTFGTGDKGGQLTAQLRPYTGPPEFTSPDRRFLYFSLATQIQQVEASMTPADRAAQAATLTHGATTAAYAW